mgnify:CR=1 FL=1
MIRGSVYLELTDHLTSEDVFRQHVFDGFLNGQLRLAVHEQAVGFRTKTAGGTAVAVVMFFVEFGTGQTDLGSVDDDDKVTGIDVGAKVGLCFPRKILAISLARRPRDLPSASTTHHSLEAAASAGLAENVRFMAWCLSYNFSASR